MKLCDQVCTLQQAKRLKELGVRQDSLFSWCGEITGTIDPWIALTHPANCQDMEHRALMGCEDPIAAAFTSAELGEMLPKFAEKKITNIRQAGSDVDLTEFRIELGNDCVSAKTAAQARAGMLIYLIEYNFITIDQINKRLAA